MRQRRKIETLKGMGKLRHGDRAIEGVPYRLEVWQDEIVTESFGGQRDVLPGMKETLGCVLELPTEAYTFIGREVELQLEDGRRWRCLLENHGGALSGLGGITSS